MSTKSRIEKKNEKHAHHKKRKKSVSIFLGALYIFVFLLITTPMLFFFGPYQNTRKVFLNTLLATRHAYLITDIFSEETIDKMLGNNETKEEDTSSEVQDMDKIKVEHTIGNNISRYDIKDNPRFYAYILEIENPKSVKVAMTKYLGKVGQKTSEMAEEHDAIAAINGGTFKDKSSDGTTYAGTGGQPGGFVISDGKVVFKEDDEDKKENVVAFTKNGELIVGDHSIEDLKDLDVQEAMCFRGPTFLVNGVRQIKDKMEEGYNPRTAVGQKADGTVIFLVIDGRKISSPGATIYDVQEIMKSRGAINAGMLDGGYSSTMYYQGEVINSPNAWNGERTVATAFYVES
ncbi:phosphodiester glycosidase family protein [Clostridium sp. BJN0001]|uniref:phosphodiester glycosidase family protein n=1 Tax=Clostridium sp. BJN0001 TaxID=2930219 RepID=UPI001FD40A8C|nr:phosphodiester glycosidase family protein [Clostridium sp. BJN0001]